MAVSASKSKDATVEGSVSSFTDFLPAKLRELADPQTAIPRIAKDAGEIVAIEAAVQEIPTEHWLIVATLAIWMALPTRVSIWS